MDMEEIHKTVRIPRSAAPLFEQFATELTSWWPRARDEAGDSSMETLAFEKKTGGKIYARLKDGSERQWGTVEVWRPPGHMRLAFHPDGREASTEIVDVTFEPSDDETLVSLRHTGWELEGERAPSGADHLHTGWEPVLGRLASEPSAEG